ncbi:cobalt-precorrin-6A reductase [Polycladidibacter stylochi]|uniref:cobalt-precorrin-6A reductase n=1 Tax=Polycladidibacter stylochi TaxID=1807766 RepID=UPI00082D0105|nr:cobalt-precorrin-6A reductase [Pseudovibrio stylochi]
MTTAPNSRPKLLILAGTRDARIIIKKLQQTCRFDIIASLAGVTTLPKELGVTTRTGGFGGTQGLQQYLKAHDISYVVDATHPFAAQISNNALQACQQTPCHYLRYERPPWKSQTGDQWLQFTSLQEAVAAIAPNSRIFAAIGRKQIIALKSRTDVVWHMRMVEPPEANSLPEQSILILSKPNESIAQEISYLKQHDIEGVLCKNSGGTAGYAKIEAARKLGLPVHMLARPPKHMPITVPAYIHQFSEYDQLVDTVVNLV